VAALTAEKDFVAAANRARLISMTLATSSQVWTQYGATFCLVALSAQADALTSTAEQATNPDDLPAAVEIIRSLLGSECMDLALQERENMTDLVEARTNVLFAVGVVQSKITEIVERVTNGGDNDQSTVNETPEGTQSLFLSLLLPIHFPLIGRQSQIVVHSPQITLFPFPGAADRMRRKRSAYIMRQLRHFSSSSATSSSRVKRQTFGDSSSGLLDAILNFVETVLSSDQLRVLLEMAGEVAAAAFGGDIDEARAAVDSFFDQLDQTVSSKKNPRYFPLFYCNIFLKKNFTMAFLKTSESISGLCLGATPQSDPERLQISQAAIAVRKTDFSEENPEAIAINAADEVREEV
jgi:hypothetical protein